jgi:hypothetical protein
LSLQISASMSQEYPKEIAEKEINVKRIIKIVKAIA